MNSSCQSKEPPHVITMSVNGCPVTLHFSSDSDPQIGARIKAALLGTVKTTTSKENCP